MRIVPETSVGIWKLRDVNVRSGRILKYNSAHTILSQVHVPPIYNDRLTAWLGLGRTLWENLINVELALRMSASPQ